MAMPPKDITPIDLFERLTAMPRPHEMVDFPRKDADGVAIGRVAMWPLREQEILQAQAAATLFTRKILADDDTKKSGDDHGYLELYNNAVSVEILQRACRRTKWDDEKSEWVAHLTTPMFPKSSDLRERLLHDEIGVLFNDYMLVQRRLGPITHQLSKPECEAWIKRLQEGGERVGLPFFSWGALIDLVSFSVDRIASLEKALSSAGSPQDDSQQSSNGQQNSETSVFTTDKE
jgi:hypothetical protein